MSIGGTAKARRFATRELNHAYRLLVAAEFQGVCRDLHDRAAQSRASDLSPAAADAVVAGWVGGRKLSFGNPSRANIRSDFEFIAPNVWADAASVDARTRRRLERLSELLDRRNAIAHSDFSRTS